MNGTVGDVVGPMRDDIFAARTSSMAIVTDVMEAYELEPFRGRSVDL
jgi:hypothetical protein